MTHATPPAPFLSPLAAAVTSRAMACRRHDRPDGRAHGAARSPRHQAGRTLPAMLLLASLTLGAAGVASLLSAPGCAAPPPKDAVVLKSGTVLDARVSAVDGGLLELQEQGGDELSLARINVRAIEGTGPFIDPPILWRELPDADTDDAEPPRNYVRSVRHDDGSGSLDVGVGLLEDPVTGRRVYLVGAVHIAHEDCFDALQSVLDSMDLVLWEGVGSKEAPTEDALERFDVLFKTQVMLKNILNLDFQLKEVDYKRAFWRNCDMSVNQLQQELDARNLKIMPNEQLFRAVFGTIFKLIDPNNIPRSEAIGRPYRATIAPLMADPDKIFQQAGAEGLKVVLIELRNRVVIDEVERELDKPDGPQRIGVFYGAGHLPDMCAKLQEERGLRYMGTHWIPAWRY